MPSMPFYYVGKGTQFRLLDNTYAGDEAAYVNALDAAITVLSSEGSTSSLEDIARQHTPASGSSSEGLSDGDIEHFASHWLGGWWPEHPVRQLLRHGFLEANRVAKEAKLPLEALWVCSEENVFHIYICRGPRQVTVIVYTPPPKEWVPFNQLKKEEPIWVVKVWDNFDDHMPGDPDVLGHVGNQQIIKRQLWCT